MELWVRVQSKTGLYKIDNVYIHEDEDKTIHIWSDGINKYLEYYLGGYNTKERALEVLGEIQKYILLPNTDGSAYVYQMPEEQEE